MIASNHGITLATSGRYAEAEATFRHALRVTRSVGLVARQGLLHAHLARLDVELGDLVSARRHLEEAERLAERAGEGRSAGVATSLALVEVLSGAPERALTLLELALAPSGQRPRAEAFTHLGIADVHLRLGHLDEARSSVDTGLARANGLPDVLAASGLVVARLALARGDAASALREAEKASEWASGVDRLEQARAWCVAAMAPHALGRTADAGAKLAEAARVARALGLAPTSYLGNYLQAAERALFR